MTLWMEIGIVAMLVATGFVGGFLVGRSTSQMHGRLRELEAELGDARRGADRYRAEVAEHFAQTADAFQSMTRQYRTLYEHIAGGARELCPGSLEAFEQSPTGRALLGTDRPDETGQD